MFYSQDSTARGATYHVLMDSMVMDADFDAIAFTVKLAILSAVSVIVIPVTSVKTAN